MTAKGAYTGLSIERACMFLLRSLFDYTDVLHKVTLSESQEMLLGCNSQNAQYGVENDERHPKSMGCRVAPRLLCGNR